MTEPTQELSRRDMLKMIAIALPISYGIGTGLGNLVSKSLEPAMMDDERINLNEFLTEEQIKLVNEIGVYRDSLSLRGLPNHLSGTKIKEAYQKNWHDQAPETVIEIPNAHRSHVEQAISIQQALFGENGKRLVGKIISDTSLTASGTFNNENRTMSLDTIDDPTSPWFTFVTTHESTHALDPSLTQAPLYPLDTLVKVSHGMARVLNQSTKIEGMFMNNPESYNIPFIKKGIGEGVATLFRQDQALIGQVDFAGHELVVSTLKSIASEQNTTIGEVKFTKKVCLKIGEALLPKILNKDIIISGSLSNDWYFPRIEAACKEIFADMVTTTLMTSKEVGNNQEILAGITEILSAIQGKQIDLNEVINGLHFPDDEIKARYLAELEAQIQDDEMSIITDITQNNSAEQSFQTEQPLLSEEEVLAIQNETTKANQIQGGIFSFMQSGTVPPEIGKDSAEIHRTMEKYGYVVSRVYQQYPEVIYGLNADDVSFDPDLHYWETYTVAEAWNVNVFTNLIIDPSLIPANLEDVKRRIGVLENFINSPAFKRLEGQVSVPSRRMPATHARAMRSRMRDLLS